MSSRSVGVPSSKSGCSCTLTGSVALLTVYAFLFYVLYTGTSSRAGSRNSGVGGGVTPAAVVAPPTAAATTAPHLPPIARVLQPPCAALPSPAVLVLTFNRPLFLHRTVSSLLLQRTIAHYSVYISQDASDPATTVAAQSFAAQHPSLIRHWIKERDTSATGPIPVFGYVAQHYKWALDRIFMDQKHSHVIIVEDDMEFAVDFLHLFESTAWLLKKDPTLMCISSWNDNSRVHLGSSPELLLRTSYFPGLGWLLERDVYVNRLRPGWPTLNHWDNWLRANLDNLDCVVPSLPRNRNFGNVGSNMNNLAFNKEIATVGFYDGTSMTNFGDVSYLLNENYEKNMRALLSKAAVRTVIPSADDVAREKATAYLILYRDAQTFQTLANYFRIWNHPRSHYKYLQMVEFVGGLFLIADVRFCPLLPAELRETPAPNGEVVLSQQNEDCDTACGAKKKSCLLNSMSWINQCETLKQYFPCELGCILEAGGDLPAYVSGELPTKGFCVRKNHADPITCNGKHAATKRICVCG